MTSGPIHLLGMLLLLAALLSACVANPGAEPSVLPPAASPTTTPTASGEPTPSPTASAEPTPTPTARPTPTLKVEPSPSLDAATAEAVRIRISWGLRAELEWIAEVAQRSDTNSDYGTPLTPDEIAELNQRAVDAEPIRGPLQHYVAKHPDEFGGMYIDQQDGGIIVTLWTAHLQVHEAAIRALIGGRTNVGFRLVRYTEAELGALQERVGDAFGWMRGIGAQAMASGLDTINNRVTLMISSANADAPRLIRERVGAGEELLQIESDGTGIHLLEPGTIRGVVLDARGKPVSNIGVEPRSPLSSWCGGGVGHSTDQKGRFELERCTPTTWTIEAFHDYQHVLGSLTVDLEPGASVEVTIRLKP